MNREGVIELCRGLKGVTEGYPFGAGVLVFKVAGKVFAILDDNSVSLKCDPGLAEVLRQQHAAVTAGYHLDKRHWNTVALDGTIADDLLEDWVQDSYALVVAGLNRVQRAALDA